MSYPQILLLAVGLALDAMAVAAARGHAGNEGRFRDVVVLALLFGGAQAVMPALGWSIGREMGPWIEAVDHWFAFLVLGALGTKMLLEARSPDAPKHPAGLSTLLALALATSVDAFAAGIMLPLLGAPFLLSIVTIGLVTSVLSATGVVLGRRFGSMFGRRLDALGGVVLIALGLKILIEHLTH